MNKNKKILVIVLVALLVIILIAGGVLLGVNLSLESKYKFIDFSKVSSSGDKIHFLNTGSSDAIIIESNGKFGMVDCGEDEDNPRNFSSLKSKGYEKMITDYLFKNCATNGRVELDFVIGTHAHSDHIGGFDTILLNEKIFVRKAFLKRYYQERIDDYEVEKWDNKEVYNQMLSAISDRGIELVQDLVGVSFELGNFDITIFNGEEAEIGKKVGENENSLAVLVEKDGFRAMLSGDMNNIDNDEERIGSLVGKVNLLKIGHHGLELSSSSNYIKALNPDIAIQTAGYPPHSSVNKNIRKEGKTPIYRTVDKNGIVIDVTNGFENIKLFKNSCDK